MRVSFAPFEPTALPQITRLLGSMSVIVVFVEGFSAAWN